MSYISQICHLLENEGVISHAEACSVLNWLDPHFRPWLNPHFRPRADYEDEDDDGPREENLQELLDDRVEMQRVARERKRRSGGGRRKSSPGCRAIKAPELNDLMTERALCDEDKCLAMVMLATGSVYADMPDWPRWSQCVETLYAMADRELNDHLKHLLSQAVTCCAFRDTLATLMSLYEGQFFPKRHLVDVCGPSVTTFLTVMQDNFDMQFTSGDKNSWLYVDAPNLVVMRHALIVRNRLRNGLTGILKAIEAFFDAFLEKASRVHMGVSWTEVPERQRVLQTYLSVFLSNAQFDNLQVLTEVFGSLQEPTEQFAKKLFSQWVASGVYSPDDTAETGERPSSGRGSLTGFVIPFGVTEIGDRAFEDCTSLTSVVIPSGVTRIGRSVFDGCRGLTSPLSVGKKLFYGPNIPECEIPQGVEVINDGAFCNCRNLTKVVIPSSVTEIGWQAFSGCWSLTSVVIPDSVTKIGARAFYGCRSLTSVVIPASVTKISCDAFSGCRSLTSVVLPASVTKISCDAFYGCHSLTSVVIPDSVTEIGDRIFTGCESLTSVVIPDSVTQIGDCAFCGCTSLTSVSVPKGADIASSAFPTGCKVIIR